MSEKARCGSCGQVTDEALAPASRMPTSGVRGHRVKQLNVVEWHDTPEPVGRPSAVAILVELEGEELPVIVRMKSAAFVNELVRALDRHRAGVWPQSKGAIR